MDNSSNGQNNLQQIKYQKLATEYSKIRAQASVLKKAVIDEQTRSLELREQLKEKEVELRRAEQELDSLNFRNQQLTKRVTVLQEDLDKIQTNKKVGKMKTVDQGGGGQNQHQILDEEFHKKIVENAQLQSLISDKTNEIDNLLDRIQHLEDKINFMEQDNNTRAKLETTELSKSTEVSKIVEVVPVEVEEQEEYEEEEEEEFVEPFSPKLSELEKELNHWKSLYNIVKIKYDEERSYNNREQNFLSNSVPAIDPIVVDNMLGRLTVPFAIPEEIEARENKIREYFFQEIDRLITEKHMCHIRNLAIAANTEVMNVHLDTSEEKRLKCEAALRDALLSFKTLQEEKEVQEGNYKLQLGTMSEHLANMNDKLIRQTEEIQQLKFELSKSSGKRGGAGGK